MLQILHLVGTPNAETSLGREIAVLILDDELLFGPITTGRFAGLNPEFLYESSFDFHLQENYLLSSSVVATALLTFTSSTSKIRVLLGSMPRFPFSP